MDGAVEEITGYIQEDFVSRIKWEDIIHPDDLYFVLKEEEKIQSSQYIDQGEIEYRIKHRDGRVRWVNEIYQKTKSKNKEPGFYQSTIYDVTEKKANEEALAKIETARKQEIHHRIKNNLQVISSLLDLQADTFSERECILKSEVLEAFRESQDRVISMALIHEELYKGGGTDKLDFSLYIQELADNLFLTYRLRSTDINLIMDLEENIFFGMDTAVPLGIIINELVSNSLKHAFPDKDKGEISIEFYIDEYGEYLKSINEDCKAKGFTLTVSDNGVGIPEEIDIEDLGSLGLQLVTSLVDQLDGKLELKRDNGTVFIIRFTVADNNNQASTNLLQLVDNE